jgi:hypothetical protein
MTISPSNHETEFFGYDSDGEIPDPIIPNTGMRLHLAIAFYRAALELNSGNGNHGEQARRAVAVAE